MNTSNNKANHELAGKLARWGSLMTEGLKNGSAPLEEAHRQNAWFTPEESRRMILAIAENYLNEEKLVHWLKNRESGAERDIKNVAIICAGNIPMVSFHDILCVIATGHELQIKLSAKDNVLLPWAIGLWLSLASSDESGISYADRIRNHDALIATGSDLAQNYFKPYLTGCPNLLRSHRNGMAVLSGSETDEELISLGHDVFDYYGLGCRNVSKLFVPENYDFTRMLRLWDDHFRHVRLHTKYQNNYDYNLALLMLNKSKFLQAETILLEENPGMSSRIATLHYQNYGSVREVSDFVNANSQKIQCTMSIAPVEKISCHPPGSSQYPALDDYADGVDTMEFLNKL